MSHRIRSLLSIFFVAVFLMALTGIRPANGENGLEEVEETNVEQGQEPQTAQGSGVATGQDTGSGQGSGNMADAGSGSEQGSGSTTDTGSDQGSGDTTDTGSGSDQGSGDTTNTGSGSVQGTRDTKGSGSSSDQGSGDTTDTGSGSDQGSGDAGSQDTGSSQGSGNTADAGSGSGQGSGDMTDTGSGSDQGSGDAGSQDTGSNQGSGNMADAGSGSDQGSGDTTDTGSGSDQGSGDTAGAGSGSDSDQEGDPEPVAISIAAVASEGINLQDGTFVVPQGQDGYIAFSWSFSEPFGVFQIKLTQKDEEGNVIVYEADQTNSFYAPSVGGLSAGSYAFSVHALSDGATVGAGVYHFAVVFSENSEEETSDTPEDEEARSGQEESEEPPADKEDQGEKGQEGGAAHGGGRKSSGGANSQSVQTSHVTAGKALSSTHASGSKTMDTFGAVNLSLPEESVTSLVVHERPGVQLDGGQKAFTAAVEEERLVLKPEVEGKVWTVNGYMLTALARSGITEISLMTEVGEALLLTGQDYQGTVYASLCAGGVVSGDYEYLISGGSVQVLVAGSVYSIDDSNMLVPVK